MLTRVSDVKIREIGPGDVEQTVAVWERSRWDAQAYVEERMGYTHEQNLGFFRVWFDGEGVIQQGRILIAADGTTQAERNHLIREEFTQSFGLFKDSWEHSDSIFYEGWTTTDKYGSLDEATIRLLYQPQLEPGMNRTEVRDLYPPTD